jgi:hypothetical protein
VAFTYYYAYSCGPEPGENDYTCGYIDWTCGHQHRTAAEAVTCVKNICQGYVAAVSRGRTRSLNESEQAEVQRAFEARK